MKSNIWGKTILTVYKHLDRVSNSIDKVVKENAFSSFYFAGNNQAKNSVMAVAERIIDLTERKKKLINLRVLADKALLECDRQAAKILIERYMDGDSSAEIANRYNLNIRTYFRHLLAAEERFCQIMAKYGYGDKKLREYLKDEKWIMDVYSGFLQEESALEAVAV